MIRVNERGPFVNNRLIDVSQKAAEILGFELNKTTLVFVFCFLYLYANLTGFKVEIFIKSQLTSSKSLTDNNTSTPAWLTCSLISLGEIITTDLLKYCKAQNVTKKLSPAGMHIPICCLSDKILLNDCP